MKNTIKISTAISAVLLSSTAFGVAGLDRVTFSPGFLFEVGNYAEITLARADPNVRPDFARGANVADKVDIFKFAYKHQINEKLGIGLLVNNQPVGVDIDFQSLGSPLRGSISAISYIVLGHYNVTDRVSVFGGLNYQRRDGNADLTTVGIPGPLSFARDTDAGYIVGGAYSIPKIALRASISYESRLEFSHETSNTDPVGNAILGVLGGADTVSASPEAVTLELQSGIAKDTLLFGSIRWANQASSQVLFLGTTQLSAFQDTTVFKLGVGRKFTNSISGSLTLSYESSNGQPASPFSPQDGERGVAVGLKYTAKNGIATSLGVSYRDLGDTTTTDTSGALFFRDNDVVTVGLKVSKSF